MNLAELCGSQSCSMAPLRGRRTVSRGSGFAPSRPQNSVPVHHGPRTQLRLGEARALGPSASRENQACCPAVSKSARRSLPRPFYRWPHGRHDRGAHTAVRTAIGSHCPNVDKALQGNEQGRQLERPRAGCCLHKGGVRREGDLVPTNCDRIREFKTCWLVLVFPSECAVRGESFSLSGPQ